MKTILKLALALAMLNAAARAGTAAFGYYQLKDAAQQMVTFGAQTSTASLQDEIVEKASELNVPVTSGGVNVYRQGMRTRAEAAYTQPLELFPHYTYPVRLSFSVEGYSMALGAVDKAHAR